MFDLDANKMSDSVHPAYPAIRLTTGNLLSTPGCLPHVCWLCDNKNRYFVSFSTLVYLNSPPKQWACFMSEGETRGGCQHWVTECWEGGGISRETVPAPKNFKGILQTDRVIKAHQT